MAISVLRVVPVLRIFDLDKATEFYIDYLGCTEDWRHQFDGRGPTYMQVSRDGLVLHLSEHHGDGTPGSVVYLATTGVRDLHAELHSRPYPSLNPGLDCDDDGSTCLSLLDPFGNTLRFDERPGSRVV